MNGSLPSWSSGTFTDEQMFWGGLAAGIIFFWYWNHVNPWTHAERVGIVIGVALSIVVLISGSASGGHIYNAAGPMILILGGIFGMGIARWLDDMRKDEQDG